MNTVSIYGGTGILGSYYRQLYETTLIPREQLNPETKEVLYLISTTDNYTYKEDPLVDIETNLVVLMKRLHACKEAGIKTFNFISSHFVYGPAWQQPTELASCEPNGFYSITKRTAEKLVMEYCAAFGITYRILRIGNVYGGPDSGSAKRNALHFLINKLRKNEDVTVDRNVSRDFMHIQDVCRAINHVMEHGELNNIYNIGTGIETPLFTCVGMAKSFLNSSSIVTLQDTPPNYPQAVRFVLDCTKLKSLGFTPNISLTEGLKDLCSSQRLCTPGRTLTEKRLELQSNL